jgi:AcrR family transcriptional regulator
MTVAMRLFAEHGFSGTTVGDIEGAAGLTPRGGGFYRHFRSKEDILNASVDAGITFENHSRAAVNLLPFGDLRSELTLVCRWLLQLIDQQRDVFRVVEREAERFPKLREKCRVQIFEAAHRAAVAFTQRWAERTGPPLTRSGVAVIMIGAAMSYRRRNGRSGDAARDVTTGDETWVHYCHDLMTGTST